MTLFQKLKVFKTFYPILWRKISMAFNIPPFTLLILLLPFIIGCKAYKTEVDPELQNKADMGDASAQFDVAKSYFDTTNHFFITTESFSENLEESAAWLEKAANQGNLQAQYHLSRYFAIRKNDLDRAFNMMKPLAEQGFAEAQYILSIHYANAWGTPKDLALAYKWNLLAFERNIVTLRNFHYYLVYENKLTHTQISEGQKLAKEHIATFGSSKLLFEED